MKNISKFTKGLLPSFSRYIFSKRFFSAKAREEKPTVIVGLSGGVDSAVAAKLLLDQGYTVIGATAIVWPDSLCCSAQGLQDARTIAKQLGIKHYFIDVIPEFTRFVVEPFVNSYFAGLTPNPCTACNRFVRFSVFVDKVIQEAKQDGFTEPFYFATGHYAEIVKDKGFYQIKKGKDKAKDQSYMLYALTQQDLARTIFPLGKFSKKKVKELARKFKLIVSEKPESQDACFVAGDYKKFLLNYSGKKAIPGDFIGPNGKVIGKHKGIAFYTIGQRRGLGVAYREPLYVKEIDSKTNRIYLGTRKDILRKSFMVKDLVWQKPQSRKFVAKVKVRYNSVAVRGLVDPMTGRVELAKFVEAITPGQVAVFYQGNKVIGGGVII